MMIWSSNAKKRYLGEAKRGATSSQNLLASFFGLVVRWPDEEGSCAKGDGGQFGVWCWVSLSPWSPIQGLSSNTCVDRERQAEVQLRRPPRQGGHG